ncbi:GNAT family N-acetyltransferase [Companilactobacillus sp.]|uniref:GNAT family N-acetyltransferase n=1 Tax=Companilactobacillus sp. TaxID=2767905 RepID=UPI002601A1F8|nr:GNAT family N-acetyltransferase [Companilactobacillus sp.]
MKDYVIKRTYGATDFDVVKDVYYQTWKTSYRGMIPQEYLDSLDKTITWHPEKLVGSTYIAVSQQNKIIGVCTYGQSRDERFPNMGEVYSIYVLPEWQSGGVGQSLLARSLHKLKAQYDQIYLAVLEKNEPAQKFYESFGFSQTEYTTTTETSYGNLHEVIYMTKA